MTDVGAPEWCMFCGYRTNIEDATPIGWAHRICFTWWLIVTHDLSPNGGVPCPPQ